MADTFPPAAAQPDGERLDDYAEMYFDDVVAPDLHIEVTAQRHSLEHVLPALGAARRVVELGYGSGLITRALCDHGMVVDVVEGSAVLCERARASLGPRASVHHSDFEDFSPVAPVDAVLAQHVLEHVEDPRALARRVLGWLPPGGTFVAVVPNSRSIHRRLGVSMGLQPHEKTLTERDHRVGHRRVYDLEELVADVTAAGFDVERTFGYFLKPLSNGQMLDFTPELLDAFNDIARDLPPDLLASIGVVCRRPAA